MMQDSQLSEDEPVRRGVWFNSTAAAKLAFVCIGPIAMSLALVGVTTVVLWRLELSLDLDPLIFIYFVPTTYIALRYGSTAAMMATIMSCVAAAYYLYPPRFSFAVASALELMQIAFFILLAMLASQVMSGFIKDSRVERRRAQPRPSLVTMRTRIAALFGRPHTGA